MRKIIKESKDNVLFENLIFDRKKIYICKIAGKWTKLSLIDYKVSQLARYHKWAFCSLEGSYDFWTGHTDHMESYEAKDLMETYVDYEIYEFDNLKEMIKFLEDKL